MSSSLSSLSSLIESSEENYLRDINDSAGIKECYDTYGCVGVTNVLTKEECETTINDFKNILVSLGCDSKLDFSKPETYDLASPYLNNYGTVGRGALMTRVLNINRTHPNVKRAYSSVFGMKESELIPCYDRFGWMRPTISIDVSNSQKYRTPEGLHLDIDPVYYFDENKFTEVSNWVNELQYNSLNELIRENNAKNIKMGIQCQGVLNLVDNEKDDGGFQFIPGGHKMLKPWYDCIENKKEKFGTGQPCGRYTFGKDEIPAHSERLPCPAGTLIIFDVKMPHGTRPNCSEQNRMVQFLRYMPKNVLTMKTLQRRQKLIDKHSKDK
jgi:hypothetical protein